MNPLQLLRVLETFMHPDRLIPALCLLLLTVAMPAAARSEPNLSVCVEGSAAAAERVIEDCDALLLDKTTAEAKVPGIFLVRAEAFVRLGRLKFALDDLGSAVARRPDNVHAYIRRAELHRTLGDTEAAIGDFSAAIRLEPKSAAMLFARGELFRVKADRRRALADYAAVLRLDPSHEGATANHKALAQEIERLGAMLPVTK